MPNQEFKRINVILKEEKKWMKQSGKPLKETELCYI